MKKGSGFVQTAFLDVLFNLLSIFVAFFFVCFVLIDPIGEDDKHDIPSEAEYLIVMTWDNNIDVDIDLWVMDDKQKWVGFQWKTRDYLHLERDDMGVTEDIIYDDGLISESQRYKDQLNEETVVFRGRPEGTYTVNAHYYRGDYTVVPNSTPIYHNTTVTVEIKLVRVNPRYEVIFVTRQEMWERNQEITFFNFDIDEDGRVVVSTINQVQNHFVNSILDSMQ